jgi:hypothetical protein
MTKPTTGTVSITTTVLLCAACARKGGIGIFDIRAHGPGRTISADCPLVALDARTFVDAERRADRQRSGCVDYEPDSRCPPDSSTKIRAGPSQPQLRLVGRATSRVAAIADPSDRLALNVSGILRPSARSVTVNDRNIVASPAGPNVWVVHLPLSVHTVTSDTLPPTLISACGPTHFASHEAHEVPTKIGNAPKATVAPKRENPVRPATLIPSTLAHLAGDDKRRAAVRYQLDVAFVLSKMVPPGAYQLAFLRTAGAWLLSLALTRALAATSRS